MSIEALWAVRYSPMMNEQRLGSGVVVFESGKIFGGDSWCYFLGTYEFRTKDEIGFDIQVRIHTNDGQAESIFGGPLKEFDLRGIGKIAPDHGRIDFYGGVKGEAQMPELVAYLERVAALP